MQISPENCFQDEQTQLKPHLNQTKEKNSKNILSCPNGKHHSCNRRALAGFFKDYFNIQLALKTLQHCEGDQRTIDHLYELNADDIDFFLPQLVTLLFSWKRHNSKKLEKFVLDCCAKSMHFALKIVQFLQALSGQSNNYQLPSPSPKLVTHTTTAIKNISPSISLELSTSILKNQSQQQKSSTQIDANLTSQKNNQPKSAKEALNHKTSNISLNFSAKTFQEACEKLEHDCELSVVNFERPDILFEKRFSSSPHIKTNSNSHSQHSTSYDNDVEKLSERDKFLFKQERCSYFTAQMDLLFLLNQISQNLLLLDRKQRNEQLRSQLNYVNGVVPHGLYFPNALSATSPHYGILNILASESHCLASRDKVPFLLQLEIEYSGYKSNSVWIARAFKSSNQSELSSPRSKGVDEEDGEVCSKEVQAEQNRSSRLHSLVDEWNGSVQLEHKSQPKSNCNNLRKSTSCPSNSKPNLNSNNNIISQVNNTNDTSTLQSNTSKHIFGEPFSEKRERLRNQSPYGHRENQDLISVIFKGGDDLRQELMAMQLIQAFDTIQKDAKLPLRLRPYNILITSEQSGIVETIINAVSIDHLKKNQSNQRSLSHFYEEIQGRRGTAGFRRAQRNFVESMAAYSLVTYFLQIKDRHNGNILIDSEGSVIHIDFGFLLSNSPGGNVNFESAPFKLTMADLELMDGEEDSEAFDLFKLLLIRGFLELKKHFDKIWLIVEIMQRGPKMPCFASASALDDFEARFMRGKSDEEIMEFVFGIVEESLDNQRTIQYDTYQRITNGIL